MPTHTIPAFLAVPRTFSVRLEASWITQYASALTAKPMTAAAQHATIHVCTLLLDLQDGAPASGQPRVPTMRWTWSVV